MSVQQPTNELNYEQMKDVLEAGTVKAQLEQSMSEIKVGQDQLLANIASPDSKDVFTEKLKEYDMDTLEKKIKNKEFVNSVFIETDGTPMMFNIEFENKEREYEFKRDLILYFKSSQVYEEKIDKAIEEINVNYKDFEDEMTRVCNTMSDNLFAFIEELKEKASVLEGEAKEKADKHILHIESAYTMEIFLNLIEKFPSVTRNTLIDFNNSIKFNEIINKYEKVCKSAKVEPLFSNIHKSETMTFEERFLVPDSYKSNNGLFLFILMRYFAMNGDIKGLNLKLHSALCVCLRNIYRNKMVDDIKVPFLKAITELLNKY